MVNNLNCSPMLALLNLLSERLIHHQVSTINAWNADEYNTHQHIYILTINLAIRQLSCMPDEGKISVVARKTFFCHAFLHCHLPWFDGSLYKGCQTWLILWLVECIVQFLSSNAKLCFSKRRHGESRHITNEHTSRVCLPLTI